MNKVIFFLLLFSFACVEDKSSPEGALKDFVEMRIGQQASREDILEKLTGKIRQSVENISDQEFEMFSNLKDVQKNSFKILTKSCQKVTCFITYAISYRQNLSKVNYETEVKKIAELTFYEGKWLIADISNIKTYHEALDPIDIVNQ